MQGLKQCSSCLNGTEPASNLAAVPNSRHAASSCLLLPHFLGVQEKGIAKLATALDDHPAIKRAYALLQDAFEQVGLVCCCCFCLLESSSMSEWQAHAHEQLGSMSAQHNPFMWPSSPQRLLPEQRLLDDEQQCQNVLAYLPNDASEPAAAKCLVVGKLRADRLLALGSFHVGLPGGAKTATNMGNAFPSWTTGGADMPLQMDMPICLAVRNAVQQRWQRVHGSEQRWEVLKEMVEEEAKVGCFSLRVACPAMAFDWQHAKCG